MLKLLAILALVALSAHANTVYISQSGSGTDSGADASDCKPVTWFNTPGNWVGSSPTGAQIGPGTTVTLEGTITAALTAQGSGSSGSPVTILFDTGAKIQGNYTTGTGNLPAAGAINLPSVSYITINGGTNGLINITGCDTASQQTCDGILITSCNNILVEYLTITGMYVAAGGGTNDTMSDNGGSGVTISFCSNLTVDHCTISQGGAGIYVLYGPGSGSGDSNQTYSNNTISAANWGIAGGGDGVTNTKLTNCLVFGNNITMPGAQWDEPDDNNHHDGIYFYCDNDPDSISGLKIYSNTVGGDFASDTTADIFISAHQSDSHGIEGSLIYNNLCTCDDLGAGDGLIYVSCDGFLVYNNTCVYTDNSNYSIGINENTGGLGAPTTGTITNNIIYNANNVSIYTNAGNGVTTLTQTDNLTTTPGFVNESAGNYNITSTAAAKGAGANEYATFTTDITGYTRASSGAWDIGAYAYQSAAPAAPGTLSTTGYSTPNAPGTLSTTHQ